MISSIVGESRICYITCITQKIIFSFFFVSDQFRLYFLKFDVNKTDMERQVNQAKSET